MSRKLTRLEDLSPEQQKVILSWGKSLAIMAGAGSGKTTTLVIKCEELLKKRPEARFAAVSFTEKSASDLRAKLSERLPQFAEEGTLSGHWVMTIHGLCNAILREYPREAGFDGEESMLSEPEAQALWGQAVQALWFEELKEELRTALDRLLTRESRDSLNGLLRRSRELASFGALEMLSDGQDADSQALALIAEYVLDRYERLKRRRGVLDFNDLEKGADRALEYESIRKFYQSKFDLVLVDEFQDTNPLQARIIRRFCRPDGSNLCVVGDPKQSIYRFRDADVSVFEEFCAQMTERHSLTWNFRSRPGIIDYTNAVCSEAFQGSMTYEPLIPKREENEEPPVLRLDVRTPRELGTWIQSEVARGVPLHQMALLLRKIRGNEKWLKALISAGIPIAVGSGGLFWEDPRVREMVAFLKWWEQPSHALSGAIFLRSPWMGISDRVLDEWVKQDPHWEKPFFASDHPMAARLLPFRNQCVRPATLLLSLLLDEKKEAELGAPLLGLWHRVEELSSRGMDFHAVVGALCEALEQGRRERDVPPPRNHGQLAVLTLHSSKGLEFPHVILVDFGQKPRPPEMPLLFWDRAQGPFLAGRDAEGERTPKNEIELPWRNAEKEKALAESKRLFYVALTRAQERLILTCPELPPKKTPPQESNPFAQDDWRSWIEASSHLIPTVAISDTAVSSEIKRTASTVISPGLLKFPIRAQMRRSRHSVSEWTLLSRCPRAYEWTYIRPRIGVREVSGEKFDHELSQQELGSRVHAALERGDTQDLQHLEQEVGAQRFQAEPLITWSNQSEYMKPAGGARVVWAELAFEIPIGKEILVGSMDRVVKDQKFSVIDFKVTTKPKSTEALIESYQTQLDLYAYALRRMSGGATAVESVLVNISPKSIQEIPVSTASLAVEKFVEGAARIASGEGGQPTPGPLCQYCQFRSQCPEGGLNA